MKVIQFGLLPGAIVGSSFLSFSSSRHLFFLKKVGTQKRAEENLERIELENCQGVLHGASVKFLEKSQEWNFNCNYQLCVRVFCKAAVYIYTETQLPSYIIPDFETCFVTKHNWYSRHSMPFSDSLTFPQKWANDYFKMCFFTFYKTSLTLGHACMHTTAKIRIKFASF